MKKLLIATTLALTAFAAAPAMARSDTHISVGFYSPAPVVYEPAPVYYGAPVVYYPPVQHVYYAPRPRPCPPRFEAWNRGHHYGQYRRYADNDWNYNHGYWH